MSQLAYIAPSSPEEAASALAASGARPLSGGTDLLVQLRAGRTKPDVIVDLKKVAGAIGIRETAGGFVIGASTSGAVLGEHAGLVRAWPGVVEGANLIGSTQVQGRASLAGNLCNASPAADGVPALIAARATCLIVGPNGRREAPVESIATGPGKTSLAPGEFILEFHLPPRPARASDSYLRLIPRTEMDIAVAGCGVNLVLDAVGIVTEAHVAIGAVAPTALLVAGAGAALVGGRLNEASLDAMVAAVRAACRPISDKRGTADYRTRIAGVLARRAALIAFERAGKALSKTHVTTTVNGDTAEFLASPGMTLLDALRDELGLTGAKEGCGSGDCGACSVMLDGRLVCSCLVLAPEVEGRRVETIEGMAQGGHLHPLQQKFLEHAALQCGFCTPGLLVASKALLDANPDPTESEARYWLAGNLCRCTGYDKIIRAVMDAAAELRQERTA